MDLLGFLGDVVERLDPMHQCGPTSNGRGHVYGFGYLFDVGPFLETGVAICVDAIGALHGVGDSEGYE